MPISTFGPINLTPNVRTQGPTSLSNSTTINGTVIPDWMLSQSKESKTFLARQKFNIAKEQVAKASNFGAKDFGWDNEINRQMSTGLTGKQLIDLRASINNNPTIKDRMDPILTANNNLAIAQNELSGAISDPDDPAVVEETSGGLGANTSRGRRSSSVVRDEEQRAGRSSLIRPVGGA